MNKKFLYIKDKEIKKELKCKVIDIPIYKCCVKILIGKNAKQLEKDWKRDYSSCGAVTRNYLKEEGVVAISFFDKKPKLEHIVHEFHHATDMIMDSIGHNRKPESDEPSAYLIGYLIKEYNKLK